MIIKEFKGFEDVYPETIKGTKEWFCGQCTPCSEANEVRDYNGNYVGTRLYLFHENGQIVEPIKQGKNVFLERPVYDCRNQTFGFLRFDFELEIIQVIEYQIKSNKCLVQAEIPIQEAGDLINVRLLVNDGVVGKSECGYLLVKHEVHTDEVNFLWPIHRQFQFECNESLDFVELESKLYTSKWLEDPDYHEEVIVRDWNTGNILEKKPGYLVAMADGSKWMMTS